MPGHFGYISQKELDIKFQKRICDALVYNENHIPIDESSNPLFYQLLVKDKRECTKGYSLDDDIETWLDGEIYEPTSVSSYLDTLRENLEHLDGYFSSVIRDKKNRKIHLITDRFGLKPLYFYQREDLISWATELKAFTIHKSFNLSVDKSAISFFLKNGYYKGNSTPFQEVKMLPPGSITSINQDSFTLKTEKYWSWDKMPKTTKDTFPEAVEKVVELMQSAVEKRCFVKDSITVALSGGMDSRLLANLLKDRNPTAFTFGKPDSDDARLGMRVASELGIHHLLFESNERNWLKDKMFSVWRTEGMFSFLELQSSPYIREFKDIGSVVFNGFGGATWLGGKFLGKKDEKELLYQHMRRRVNQGSIDVGKSLIQRKPYMDFKLLEYILSLPPDYRSDYRLFQEVAKKLFTEELMRIPWENTMIPFSNKSITNILLRCKWPSIRRRLRLMNPAFDYKPWVQTEAFKNWADTWVFNNDLIHSVLGKDLISDAKHDKELLGRLMSTSIWLHQSSNIQP